MAGALGFILNAAGILIPLGLQAKYSMSAPQQVTSVQIIAGSGSTSGGNVPHIALWDDDGNRIGQYNPGRKDKLKEGDAVTISVPNNENYNTQADPYYVMLSNFENDAICIAAVTVSNQEISGTFFGDTGYLCGQSWFPSQNSIGSDFQKPKCVWLDGDHTNGINARALSFHLNDMAPDQDKLAEYQDMPDTLCRSTPRFSFWGNLLPDSEIPIFKPKLEYKVDSATGGQGADEDPQRVIDKYEYDKAVYMYQGPTAKRAVRAPPRGVQARGANHNPGHLIITEHPHDDVREVCEHPNSYGWDIVSTVQNLYCDMEYKQLYPVCNGREFVDNCFDSVAKIIVPTGGVNATDELAAHVPRKAYTSQAYWVK